MNNITKWLTNADDKTIDVGLNIGCSTCPAYSQCKMWEVLYGGFPCAKAFIYWALKDEEADKYRWHDLRKNPNDLPKEDMCGNSKEVLVGINAHYDYDIGEWVTHGGKFLAWKEPYEEVEEE